MQKIEKPKIIYKYESFNTRSLENLKAQSVYFGSPLKFNDPYDCAITAGIKTPTDEEIEQVRQKYLKRNNIRFATKQELIQSRIQQLREMFVRIAKETFSKAKNDFLKNNGVTCFSERNDDLLMWAHYGGAYKGFCLEFSTDDKLFDKMRKVRYCSYMPKVDIVPELLDYDCDQSINDLYCTKSVAWEYEKEWRSIHKEAGTLFDYEAKTLKAIYFGPDIGTQSMEIICLILGGQNPDVKFWRGIRSEDEFKVVFEQFTYTPYIKAKELGLR